MSKKLVAYFSASGVTKSVAERLANIANADLFEIEPTEKYTNKDLDWMDKKSRTTYEKDHPDFRPEIKSKVENMEQYDEVFVGFPIWWYVAPNIIDTFLESYDFSNKKVIPFATSGSSGLGRTVDVLKPLLCDSSTKWDKGRMMNHISDDEIKKWVESL